MQILVVISPKAYINQLPTNPEVKIIGGKSRAEDDFATEEDEDLLA